MYNIKPPKIRGLTPIEKAQCYAPSSVFSVASSCVASPASGAFTSSMISTSFRLLLLYCTLKTGIMIYYSPLTIVITGGTGSLGSALVDFLLAQKNIAVIRILSRDELKQKEMAKKYGDKDRELLRFFIGDVRDEERLNSAFHKADIVIHAAAMKQIEACEYNPYEAVKTNVVGTHNVISACVKQHVSKAMFISTDKAQDPVNLYGATKLVAEKMWLHSNEKSDTKFSVCRWGNVMGSRGSVIPLFEYQKNSGVVTVTHKDMTRFWITMQEAVTFLWDSVKEMKAGKVYIPELRSAKIMDLAKTIAPHAKIKYVGMRKGEKLHEKLSEGYYSNDKERLMTFDEVKKLYESIQGQ